MTHYSEHHEYFTTSSKQLVVSGRARIFKVSVFTDPDARGEGFIPGEVAEVSIDGHYVDMDLIRKEADTFKTIQDNF